MFWAKAMVATWLIDRPAIFTAERQRGGPMFFHLASVYSPFPSVVISERCYSCVWVFVFAARSPTKIVWNSEIYVHVVGDDSKTLRLDKNQIDRWISSSQFLIFALFSDIDKKKKKRKHLLKYLKRCLFARESKILHHKTICFFLWRRPSLSR